MKQSYKNTQGQVSKGHCPQHTVVSPYISVTSTISYLRSPEHAQLDSVSSLILFSFTSFLDPINVLLRGQGKVARLMAGFRDNHVQSFNILLI